MTIWIEGSHISSSCQGLRQPWTRTRIRPRPGPFDSPIRQLFQSPLLPESLPAPFEPTPETLVPLAPPPPRPHVLTWLLLLLVVVVVVMPMLPLPLPLPLPPLLPPLPPPPPLLLPLLLLLPPLLLLPLLLLPLLLLLLRLRLLLRLPLPLLLLLLFLLLLLLLMMFIAAPRVGLAGSLRRPCRHRRPQLMVILCRVRSASLVFHTGSYIVLAYTPFTIQHT